MARNIGGEFNLAVWQMKRLSANLNPPKYSANGDYTDLHIYAADALPDPAHAEIAAPRFVKLKSANLQKLGKMTNPPNIYFPPIFPAIWYDEILTCLQ